MGKSNPIYIIACLVLFFASCKTSYERIRTSSDSKLILQTADHYFDEKEYFKAQGLYEIILTSFRGQKEAEEIYFKYAQTHYFLREYELASYLYKNFANTFINSSKKEEADFMSVYSLYKTSPGYRLDQSATEKAIEGFQLFINSNPNSNRVGECNKLIDECRAKLELKAFESAKLYYDMENYQACVRSLQNLLNDFPETGNAREVRLLMCKSAYQLAEHSIFEKQKERFEEARGYAEEFLKKHPGGRPASDVRGLLNKINRKLKSELYVRHQDTSTGN